MTDDEIYVDDGGHGAWVSNAPFNSVDVIIWRHYFSSDSSGPINMFRTDIEKAFKHLDNKGIADARLQQRDGCRDDEIEAMIVYRRSPTPDERQKLAEMDALREAGVTHRDRQEFQRLKDKYGW